MAVVQISKIQLRRGNEQVDGIPQLSGAPVEATDIRAGAGLVLAALVSEGETTVDGAFHIDRGYPNFAEDLRALGANVTRV